jgi:hypothetical protein
MARKSKQTVDFFPHYCLHKMTMFIVEEKYGNNGYAFWFKLLEMLGVSNGHYIDCNKDATWEFVQAKTKLTSELCTEILDTLAKLDAIDKELWDNRIIWSDNFVEGLSEVYSHRANPPTKPTVEMVLNPWKSLEILGNSLTKDKIGGNPLKSLEILGNPLKPDEINNETPLNNSIEEYSRVEESRGNSLKSLEILGNPLKSDNNKKKEFSPSVYLTTIEYDKLIERFGEKKTKDKIENLSLYKQSKGKKYASDYATILNWDRRDEKEKNTPTMPKKRFEPGVPDDYDELLKAHVDKIHKGQGE